MRAKQSTLPPDIFALAEIFARIAERGRNLREVKKQIADSEQPLVGESESAAGTPSGEGEINFITQQ